MGSRDCGGDNNSNGYIGPVDDGEGGHLGLYLPCDPYWGPTGHDLIPALANTDRGSLQYFYQNFLKNLDGPEADEKIHLKM